MHLNHPLLVLLVFLSCTGNLAAQYSTGLIAGISRAHFPINEERYRSVEKHSNWAPLVGLRRITRDAEFRTTLELLYLGRNSEVRTSSGGMGGGTVNTFAMDVGYLFLQIRRGAYLSPRWGVYVDVGFYGGVPIRGRVTEQWQFWLMNPLTHQSGRISDPDGYLRTVDFGVIATVGYEWPLDQHWALTLESRFGYSISSGKKDFNGDVMDWSFAVGTQYSLAGNAIAE